MLKAIERYREVGLHPKELGRLSLVIAGLAIVVMALAVADLRRPDGWLLPQAWILTVVGFAVILSGLAIGTAWQKAAWLFGIALVGQATALGLINAPNYNVLQHYHTIPELLSSGDGLLLLGPLAQTVVVLVLGWRHRKTAISTIGRMLSKIQIVILLGFIGFGLTNGSFFIIQFASNLILSGWVLIISAINLLLVVAAMPSKDLEGIREKVSRSFATEGLTWDRLVPWGTALWVTVVSGVLAWFVFEGLPHIPDGVSHFFEAKYFATGNLYLPPPPEVAAFDFEKMYSDGTRWFAYGFPGWPSILSLGVLTGIPWFVNPVLAGISVLLTHTLVSRMYNRSLAHIVVLLLAVSPWFLYMSASFMSHTLTVVWTLIALLAIAKSRESSPIFWGLIAGAALGGLLLTRPLEAVFIGAAIGIWVIWRSPKQAIMPLAGMAVGGIVIGGLIFPYNNTLTGDPLLTAHQMMTDARYYPGADRIGFGPEVGTYGWRHLDPFPGHGPVDVVINAQMNTYMSNFELFGWGFGSLIFVALLLLWRRTSRQDLLFVLVIAAIIAGHSLFWFSGGPDFGARYWYQIMIPLVILTARGIHEVQRRWAENGGSPVGASRVAAFVVAASVIAVVAFMPWRSFEKYHDYRNMDASLSQLSRDYDFGHSVVFIEEVAPGDYNRGFVLNSPLQEAGKPIYVRDLGEESRARLMSHYPDRQAWLIRRQDAFDGPFEIVAGPISN